MALKATYDENGAVINNAYFKIDSLKGSKEMGLSAKVFVFYNKAARLANKKIIGDPTISTPWDGTGNPYNILYAYLKTIYTDAVDD